MIGLEQMWPACFGGDGWASVWYIDFKIKLRQETKNG
jgi:hypothetical protein